MPERAPNPIVIEPSNETSEGSELDTLKERAEALHAELTARQEELAALTTRITALEQEKNETQQRSELLGRVKGGVDALIAREEAASVLDEQAAEEEQEQSEPLSAAAKEYQQLAKEERWDDMTLVGLAVEEATARQKGSTKTAQTIAAIAKDWIMDEVTRPADSLDAGDQALRAQNEELGLDADEQYADRLEQFEDWVTRFSSDEFHHSRTSKSVRPTNPSHEDAPTPEVRRPLKDALKDYARESKPLFTWAYWKGRWNARAMNRRVAEASNDQEREGENKKTRRAWIAGSLALFVAITTSAIAGDAATEHAAQEHVAESSHDDHDVNRQFWEGMDHNKVQLDIAPLVTPTATPETAAQQAAFNIKKGEGGLQLFKDLGLTSADWYAHKDTLATQFPGDFYNWNGDVRILNTGPLSAGAQQYIKAIKG